MKPLVAWRRALAGALVFAMPAHAWGPLGHEVVARLAAIQMSPASRAAAKSLLNGRSLLDVSNWADERRDEIPGSNRWHYVDIPRFSDHYDAKRDCPRGACVIAAIDRFRAELTNGKTAASERAMALKFLVHLIADLHQPMHCIDDGDAGGNDLRVRFFNKRTNLHWVWDTGLLDRFRLDTDHLVHLLNDEIAARDHAAMARGTPVDWAMEAHAIAIADAYDFPSTPWPYLGRRYLEDNRSVVELQLMRAAVRLGRVLDDALGG